jgi:hypothetical protein
LAQPLRPDTSVGVLNILETSANSDYQSLQLSYSGKIGKDLTLRASYTYSKFLDDISDIAGTNTNVDRTVLALDESRLFLDRGLSNLHIGQVLSFTYLYRLPFFKSNRYLGGWTISGMQSAQSGRPFTIYTGTNTPIGSNNQRPLATPGSLLFSPSSQTAIQYGAGFNATLLRPGALDFGTLGRNTGQTDSFLNLSASLQKDFRILEGVSAQMRAEVYNLTNTTNFLTIDSVMSSANFGRYTVAGDSRRIQFALRFVF